MAVETQRHLIPNRIAAAILNFDHVMGIQLAAAFTRETARVGDFHGVGRAVICEMGFSDRLNVPSLWSPHHDAGECQQQLETVRLLASGSPKRCEEPPFKFFSDRGLDGTIRDGHIGTKRDVDFAGLPFGLSRPPETSTPTSFRMARASWCLITGSAGGGCPADLLGVWFFVRS